MLGQWASALEISFGPLGKEESSSHFGNKVGGIWIACDQLCRQLRAYLRMKLTHCQCYPSWLSPCPHLNEATSFTAVGHYQRSLCWGHSGCWYCLDSRGPCYSSPLPWFPTFWPTSHNLSNHLNIFLLLSDFCFLDLCHELPVPSSCPRQYSWAVSLGLSQNRYQLLCQQGDTVNAKRALDSSPSSEASGSSYRRTSCQPSAWMSMASKHVSSETTCHSHQPWSPGEQVGVPEQVYKKTIPQTCISLQPSSRAN